MSSDQDDGPFFCPSCGGENTDVTDLVLAERDEQMIVLRTTRRSGRSWSVIVTCPLGHEVVVDGEFA